MSRDCSDRPATTPTNATLRPRRRLFFLENQREARTHELSPLRWRFVRDQREGPEIYRRPPLAAAVERRQKLLMAKKKSKAPTEATRHQGCAPSAGKCSSKVNGLSNPRKDRLFNFVQDGSNISRHSSRGLGSTPYRQTSGPVQPSPRNEAFALHLSSSSLKSLMDSDSEDENDVEEGEFEVIPVE